MISENPFPVVGICVGEHLLAQRSHVGDDVTLVIVVVARRGGYAGGAGSHAATHGAAGGVPPGGSGALHSRVG